VTAREIEQRAELRLEPLALLELGTSGGQIVARERSAPGLEQRLGQRGVRRLPVREPRDGQDRNGKQRRNPHAAPQQGGSDFRAKRRGMERYSRVFNTSRGGLGRDDAGALDGVRLPARSAG